MSTLLLYLDKAMLSNLRGLIVLIASKSSFIYLVFNNQLIELPYSYGRPKVSIWTKTFFVHYSKSISMPSAM